MQGHKLSPAQRHIWLLQQANLQLPYRVQCIVFVRGRLEVAILKTAVASVVRRHEILRTIFRVPPGDTEPLQFIDSSSGFYFEQVDLSEWEVDKQADVVDRLFQTAKQQRIDLEHGPALHVWLLTHAKHEHRLIIALPALCADTLTLKNLVSEIGREYEAGLNQVELSDEPLQYVESIQWLNDLLETEEADAGREYWRKQAISTRQSITLPLEQPLKVRTGFKPQVLNCTIGREELVKIQQIARRHEAAVADYLLACWCILLWRHSGQSELMVFRSFDGRTEEDLENALGLLTRYLPLVCCPHSSTTFPELLQQIQKASREADTWQETFSWEQADDPTVEIDKLDSPGYCFDCTEQPAAWHDGQLCFLIEKQYGCLDRFKMGLICRLNGDSLVAEFHFDQECFTTEAARSLAEQFRALLKSIGDAPDALIGRVDMLGESARQRLLVELNDTSTPFRRHACIHRLFEQQAEGNPRAIAVVSGFDCITYGELNRRANQLAHHLIKMGAGAEMPIGLCVERSVEMVVGLLGILKVGGTYLPLDPEYPVERLSLMMNDAQPPVVLTREEHFDKLPAHWGRIICFDSDQEQIEKESEENPASTVDSENLAYVMYTSGSSGMPKAVCISHQNILRLVTETDYVKFGQEQVFLQLAPLSFDASTFELWGSLLHGARLVLMPPQRPTLEEIAGVIRDQRVTTLWLTAGLFHLMADEQPEALAGVGQLLAGGDVLSVSHVEKVSAAQARTKSGGVLINGYGPTESTTFACCHRLDPENERKMGSVPLGRPIANTEVYVLDERMEPLPVGAIGEIYIGGAGLSRGYLNRPEMTAEKFIPHPFGREVGGRLYRTGDLGRIGAEGWVEFIGRGDQQVKVRGYRIELGEIEAVLRRHRLVSEAVVIAREEGHEKRLVAYLTATDDETTGVGSGELRGYLQEQLPDYMIPSKYLWLAELPLTGNGKIDRRALERLEVELESDRKGAGQRARTPIEEVLCEIWGETLGVAEVGVEENFFELGGHSLLATQVVSRVREACRVEVPLRVIFEQPTVADLARAIEQEKRTGALIPAMEIEAVGREGLLQLSFAQERLWFLDQLEPDNAFYNVPAALHIQGQLNLSVLEQTLSEIVRRHETLRTVFQERNGRLVQLILPPQSIEIPVLELSEYPPAERESRTRQLAAGESNRPFDLSTGPLLRVLVLKLALEEHVLLFNMHHIITDGWSMGVLIREVVALYQAFTNREPSPLPDLKVQYADFASWQRNVLEGTYLQAQLDYWNQHLAGAPPLLSLPTDRPRPSIQNFHGATKPWQLSENATNDLKTLSRSVGVSLYMTVLAAFKVLLYRYSGQSDIVVGSPIANRNRAEIENLIGFFVNTLALRTDLSGNPSFRELLARVREVTLNAYLHQELPFEKLVEALAPDRSLSRQHLFQVMFIFNNSPMPVFRLPGLTIQGIELNREVTKFDLTFIMLETEGVLKGYCDYSTDLFDDVTIDRLISHFQTLLSNIVADPDRTPDRLPILNAAEQGQLLVEWNNTQTPYLREGLIHQLFEEQASRHPGAIAVIDGDKQITYGELNRRANQLAHYLLRFGVGPEVLVGLLAERSIQWVIGLLAIFKAGGAHVSLDPTYPKERLIYIMKDAGSPVLLTEQRFVSDEIEPEVQIVCTDSDLHQIECLSEQNPVSRATSENLAYVVYTSGSTGHPKGAMNTHGSLVNLSLWHQRAFQVTSEDRASQVANMGFDASVWELWPYLISGASLYLVDEETRLSPGKMKDWLARKRITIGWLPPVLAEALLLEEDLAGLSLRVLLAGSDKLLLHPPASTGFAYYNTYGPTEATVISTYGEVPPPPKKAGLPSIGRPIDNTQIYILDRLLQPVPIGVCGELYIGGDGLSRGYLGRPILTAEKFIPHPFGRTPGERLYRTGDLARHLDGGNIEFIGRNDAQVKIHGFRIELGEVETLLSQHPGIEAAAVTVQEDSPTGKRLVAYVVPKRAYRIRNGELRDFLRQRLPDYMLPAVFAEINHLPLSPNGKVDRRALPKFDMAQAAGAIDYAPPRTTVEAELVEIWLELLKLEHIGIHQSFFESGGHSLLATQLASRIREKFEAEILLREIFESPTIAGLAAAIERSRQAQGRIESARIRVNLRGRKSLDELIEELNQLSESEAQTLLSVALLDS